MPQDTAAKEFGQWRKRILKARNKLDGLEPQSYAVPMRHRFALEPTVIIGVVMSFLTLSAMGPSPEWSPILHIPDSPWGETGPMGTEVVLCAVPEDNSLLVPGRSP